MTASKPELYRELAVQLKALLAGEPDRIANAANMAALIYHGLPDLNWAGFYFRRGQRAGAGAVPGQARLRTDPARQGRLRHRCFTGGDGSGPDVHDFPGHIACDPASRSELVVPLIEAGEVSGVLDLDSPLVGRFDEMDQAGLRAAGRTVRRSPPPALGGLAVATERCREAARAGRAKSSPAKCRNFLHRVTPCFLPRQAERCDAGHSEGRRPDYSASVRLRSEGGGMMRLSKAAA